MNIESALGGPTAAGSDPARAFDTCPPVIYGGIDLQKCGMIALGSNVTNDEHEALSQPRKFRGF